MEKENKKEWMPNRNCPVCGGQLIRSSVSQHICTKCGRKMWLDPKDCGVTTNNYAY